MQKLSQMTTVSRNPEVAFTQIDSDLVLMGPKDQLFYGINAVGTDLWSLLEHKPMSVGNLCAYIMQNYEVETTAYCL